MITVTLQGFDELQRRLSAMPKQLQRGVASGMNRTARAMEQHLLVEMERTIDRPTPFTLNAIGISQAKPKPAPSVVIYVRPLQLKYLRYAIEGGTLDKILTPILSNLRLNKYGNVVGKRGGLDKIAAAKTKRFVATINGVTGVWERCGPKLRDVRLLVEVKHRQNRAPRWDFYRVGMRVIRDRLKRDVTEAIDNEIRSQL